MSVIVAYASAGAGHYKCAEAIYKHLKEDCPGLDVKLVDALDKSLFLFSVFYRGGYSVMVRHFVYLWLLLYYITSLDFLRILRKFLARLTHRLNTKSFAELLIREQPDVVISTHFLPSEIAAYLKRTKKINSRLSTVITDFSAHPYWLNEFTDRYIVASGIVKEQLIASGVPEGNIQESGIPVSSKFLKRLDKRQMRQRLGIAPDKFTLLIMTGSFGFGPLEEIVRALHLNAQMLVVCASNKGLYKRLKAKNYKEVTIFGFVENMEELMAASDMIITKPGGLTISETLQMELPAVFISAIPGHEENNIGALKSYGLSLAPQSVEELKNIVIDFKLNPKKLAELKEKIRELKKPDCLKEISDVVC